MLGRVARSSLSEDQLKSCFLCQLMLGNPKLSEIFMAEVNPAGVREILRSLVECQPPDTFKPTKLVPDPYFIRWECSRILRRRGVELEKGDEKLGIADQLEFSRVKEKSVDALLKLVRNGGYDTHISSLGRFIEKYVALMKEFPSLMRSILPDLSSSFGKYPFEKLYEIYGATALALSQGHSLVDISEANIRFMNDADNDKFWSIEDVYSNPVIALRYQKTAWDEHRFPDPATRFPEPLSLVHMTVVKQICHVDVIMGVSRALFDDGDYESAYAIGESHLGEMKDWLFLSHFTNWLDDFDKLASVIEKIPYSEGSIAAEVIQRFKNDCILINRVRKITGVRLGPSDFVNESIAGSIVPFLKDMSGSEIDDLTEIKLFCVDDKSREMDMNFIWGYYALAATLWAVMGKEPSGPRNLELLEGYLSRINDMEAKETMVVDLFSLIFLMVDGKFLCTCKVAEEILRTLIDVNIDNTALTRRMGYTHRRVLLTIALEEGEELSISGIQKGNQMQDALQRHDWIIAEGMAKMEEKQFVHLYQIVTEHSKSLEAFDPRNKSVQASIEIALSFPSEIAAIEKAAMGATGDVAELLKATSRDRLRCIKVMNAGEISELSARLIRLSFTSWTTAALTGKDGCVRLEAFFKHCDFIMPLLLMAYPGKTIADVRTVDPKALVEVLMRAGYANEAVRLAEYIGLDIREIVIHDLTYPRNVVMEVCGDVPAFQFLASLVGDWKDVETTDSFCQRMREEKDFVLEREATTALCNTSERIDWLDRHTQDGCTTGVVAEEMRKLLKAERWDEEAIIEMSYRMDPDELASIFNAYTNIRTLKQLVDIATLCPVDEDYLRKNRVMLGALEAGLDPFDRKTCFRQLLEKRKIDEAAAFYSTLHTDAFDDIVKEFIGTDVDVAVVAPCLTSLSRSAVETTVELDVSTIDVNDICTLKELLRGHPELDCDSVIFKRMLKSVSAERGVNEKIQALAGEMRQYESCIRAISQAFTFANRVIGNVITDVVIDSKDIENDMFWALYNVMSILTHLKDRLEVGDSCDGHERISCLYDFVREFIFHRYKISYSLHELQTRDFGIKTAELCGNLDLGNLACRIGRCYDVSIDHVIIKWIRESCELSIFNDELPAMLRKGLETERCISDEIGALLRNMPVFAAEMVANGISNRSAAVICELSDENRRADVMSLTKYLCTLGATECVAKFWTENGRWKDAIDIVTAETDINNIRKIFSVVFNAAISGHDYVQFKSFLDNGGVDRAVLRDCITYIFSHMNLDELRYLQLERDLLLGAHESVASLAIELFSETPAHEALPFLQIATKAINTELDERASGKTDFRLSAETLERHLAIIVFQTKFHMTCTKHDVPTGRGLSLFSSSVEQESIVVVLLRVYEFADALGIARYFNLDIRVIASRLIDAVYVEISADEIIEFATQLRDGVDRDTFVAFVFVMVPRLWLDMDDTVLAGRIIAEVVTYSEVRCRLWLQIGEIDTAATVAVDDGVWSLLPFIARVAWRRTDQAVVTKCLRALSNRR